MKESEKKIPKTKKRKKVAKSLGNSPSVVPKERRSLDEKVRPVSARLTERKVSQSLPQSPKRNSSSRNSLKVEEFKKLLLKVKQKNELVSKIDEDEKKIADEIEILKQQFTNIVSKKSESIQTHSFGFGEQLNARLKRVKLARTTPSQIIDVVELLYGAEKADLVYEEMRRLHEEKHSGKFDTKIYERSSKNDLKRKRHIEL